MRHIHFLHYAHAGLDHVMGDHALLAQAVTDRTIWMPDTIRLSGAHSAVSQISVSQLFDVAAFPPHLRVYRNAAEVPPTTYPLAYNKIHIRSLVAALAASDAAVQLKLEYITRPPGVLPNLPLSPYVKAVAAAAAEHLGPFCLLHLRMGDKTRESRYDTRCFNEEVFVPAFASVLPPGSRLYLMTNDKQPGRFALLHKTYDVKAFTDVPVLTVLAKDNYLLYAVEKAMSHLATASACNVRRTGPPSMRTLKEMIPDLKLP